MDAEELKQVKRMWAAMAEAYGRPIQYDLTLSIAAQDLADLPLQPVMQALTIWRRNPKNRQMPLPVDIRELVQPSAASLSLEDDARRAAALIVEAVGRYSSDDSKRAREMMGQLAWEVVKAQGGWGSIVRMISSYDVIPIYQGQWRELALVIAKRAAAGLLQETPLLPNATHGEKMTGVGKLAQDLLAQMPAGASVLAPVGAGQAGKG